MKPLFCAIAISLYLFPRCAFGYCGVPEIKANGEYFQSDVVFTGTVVSSRYTDRDVGGWYYRVRATRVFRGPTQAGFYVYTEDSDIRFPLEKNRSYLLFAYRRHGRLEIDSCGNSGLLSTAAESIRSIEAIPQALPFGIIEGWVAAETDGIDVSGVRVTVSGRSRNYTAVTNKDGWFHFRAPVGAYKVDFSSGEYYLNGGDQFRYDPNHFVLHVDYADNVKPSANAILKAMRACTLINDRGVWIDPPTRVINYIGIGDPSMFFPAAQLGPEANRPVLPAAPASANSSDDPDANDKISNRHGAIRNVSNSQKANGDDVSNRH